MMKTCFTIIVVCERDGTDTSRGFFDWPESYPNEIIRLPCVNGTTVRMCDSNGVWEPPFINDCYASIDAIIKHVIEVYNQCFIAV